MLNAYFLLTPRLLQRLLASRWPSVGLLRVPGSFHVVALPIPRAQGASVGPSAFTHWRRSFGEHFVGQAWQRPQAHASIGQSSVTAHRAEKPGNVQPLCSIGEMKWALGTQSSPCM